MSLQLPNPRRRRRGERGRPVTGDRFSHPRLPGDETSTDAELFRMLVTSVRDYAIFALDPRGFILTWNEGAQRIKGYRAEEIIGKHFSTFYPEADKAAGKPREELRIASAEGRFEEEGWRIRKDGGRFWASVVITAVRTASGELVGFAKVTRDLTEHRAAELEAIDQARRLATEEAARTAAEQRASDLALLIERMQAQAEELRLRRREAEAASRAKSDFLAVMSHELRTPLNAIAGYVDLILMGLRGPVTPEQEQDLQRVRRSQRHLLSLINDVLDFARADPGSAGVQTERVALRPLVEEALSIARPHAAAKGLTLATPACAPELVALGDREKLGRVLHNLLSNAVKFTDPGGRITLACDADETSVLLRVSDTGCGIPADELEHIFEPFVQLDSTLTRTAEGTGLGLAISRDLARAMGGDVTAESEPGKGATFTVRVPRG